MTSGDFYNWRQTLHLSRRKSAQLLGISQNTAARYESGARPIPPHIALACHALAVDLKPWPPHRNL